MEIYFEMHVNSFMPWPALCIGTGECSNPDCPQSHWRVQVSWLVWSVEVRW